MRTTSCNNEAQRGSLGYLTTPLYHINGELQWNGLFACIQFTVEIMENSHQEW